MFSKVLYYYYCYHRQMGYLFSFFSLDLKAKLGTETQMSFSQMPQIHTLHCLAFGNTAFLFLICVHCVLLRNKERQHCHHYHFRLLNNNIQQVSARAPVQPLVSLFSILSVPQSSATHRISYESWLASRGLMLSPFHVRWQTTMFNRLFAYCARINPHALYLW